MENLYPIIRSNKKYLIFLSLILIAGLFLLWQRNGRLGSSRCKNLGSLESTIGGSRYIYKVYEQGVCYKEDCVIYDNPQRAWCELKGFRKIEGADPSTFVLSTTGAMDKNSFYQKDKKVLFSDPASMAYHIGYLLNSCKKQEEDISNDNLRQNSIEKMRALCAKIKDALNKGQNESQLDVN